MTRPHTAGRRRRFSGRPHELREREADRVERISFKVAAADTDAAVVAAKAEAHAEGWRIRTLATCRPSGDGGQWIVTFAAVRS